VPHDCRLRRRARLSVPPSPAARANGESVLDHYLREIAAFAPLPPAEEVALAARIRDGDQDALDALVRANLRFVVAVAKRYQDKGVPLADLVNEGNLGLVRAAARYDGERGVRFISYAVWWIRQAICQLLAEQGRPVRVPPNRAVAIGRIGRRARTLRHALGREATPAELAAEAGVTREEAATAMAIPRRHLSLDAPLAPGAGVRWLDHLPDRQSPPPDEAAIGAALAEAVASSLSALPAREGTILRLYFGLDGGDPKTLEEIGVLLGVTKERVRQIKGAALAKLRDGREGRALAHFH
jgi:RNA polymerase primary sigma factor